MWFLIIVQIPPDQSVRMQDSLNCNISQTSRGMKLNLCVWLDIHRSKTFVKTFHLGMPKVIASRESASSQE